jgi:galactose oxidase
MEGVIVQPQRQAGPVASAAISQAGWTATADSSEQDPANAFDGNSQTIWQTTAAPLPHTITIDMQAEYNVDGVTYLPRQDDISDGNIGQHRILTSTDGVNFKLVAFGTWFDDNKEKTADFDTIPARFIRIEALSEAGNRGTWTSAAEINVYQAASYVPPPSGLGKWGPTIDFPVIPVAASVEPTTGKVVAWSASSPISFGGPGGRTLTAIYDPAAQTVSQRVVTETGHDMFCPGISMDANGRTIVTGGSTSEKTSIYDPASDTWSSAANFNIPRGYQASTTCSDGRIFMIGGSWSGGQGGKNGEIYDPKSNSWSLLGGCPVGPMLTADRDGVYRSDNHAWLFGWKNGSVFQAGPSSAMNWYGTSGSGSQQGAGKRAEDDSMCGSAVMYDAIRGKILTFGGSPNYQGTDATAAAHIVTLGNPGSNPEVAPVNSMNFPRTFHNSVVLPDGKVFTAGGQSHGAIFNDVGAQFTPELWNPATNQWTSLVPNSIPRVYHSVAVLLQDATVFVGGGGLCDTCSANHNDAQVYTPQYLLNGDGSPANRPVIISVSSNTVVPGTILTVNTDTRVTTMSLVRYGSATHALNTDQRRIPLTARAVGPNSYRVVIPGDYGIALPGFWMLFAMDAAGHPSVAATIQITAP